MRFLFFVLLMIACGGAGLQAQPKAGEDVLKGSLSVGGVGGEVFAYELHITEERSGKFTGYAVIFSQPARDSRAPVSGRIDRAAGTLSFAEESIEYNHGFDSKAIICLIRATLRYNPQAYVGRVALTGATESSDYAQADCTRGVLSFNGDSVLRKLFARPDAGSDAAATSALLSRVNGGADSTKKTTRPNGAMPVAVRYRSPLARQAAQAAAGAAPTATPRAVAPPPTAPPPPPTPAAAEQPKPTASAAVAPPAKAQPAVAGNQQPTPRQPIVARPKEEPPPLRIIRKPTPPPAPTPKPNEPPTITAGVDAEFDWESDTLYLEVWDGGRVDNDQVSVVYNNQVVLSRYLLKAEKKVVAIRVAGGETQLRILAVQEGSEPPNTANLLLRDGAKSYPLVAHNTVGKVAIIKIRKKSTAPAAGS